MRRIFILLLMTVPLVALGRVPSSVSVAAPLAQKHCKMVTKKVHGKKKKVKVCTRPVPTPSPTPDSPQVPDPFSILVIPVDIPGYSSVDVAEMQRELAQSTAFLATYGINVKYTVASVLTVKATDISSKDAPCSISFNGDEYTYALRQGLWSSSSPYITLFNMFTHDQCASVKGWAGETGSAGGNWSVIDFPYDQAVVIHEDLRKLAVNQEDKAQCDTADCVANAQPDVGDDVMGSDGDHGGLTLPDQIELGLRPNVESLTSGNQTLTIEPRAQMDAGVKGIELPFTVKGQIEHVYVGLRSPIGGDARVAEPEILATVWSGKKWHPVEGWDPDIEVPPLRVGDVMTDSPDGWTLTVMAISTSSATLAVSFNK